MGKFIANCKIRNKRKMCILPSIMYRDRWKVGRERWAEMEMAPFEAGREEFVSFVLSNFWDDEDGMAMASWYNPKVEISKASQTENGGMNSQRNMRGFAWVSGWVRGGDEGGGGGGFVSLNLFRSAS